MPRTLLTDELWSKLLIILLELGLYDKSNLRRTIEGILYRMRTGCPWRDLPASFGKFQAVYNCFNRWSKKGIIQEIFKKLSTDTDKEWLMMDGSHIRAHQHSAGAAAHSGEDDHAIGISRGGATSKIHLIVDACGNPLEVIITAGNVNDVSIAPELIAAVDLAETEVVSADKGYDSDKLRAQIEEEGSKANIPYKCDREKKNKDMDWYLYKIRHLVENAFARLKHYRAIATRYDKLKHNYLSTVLLGCIMVWLPL